MKTIIFCTQILVFAWVPPPDYTVQWGYESETPAVGERERETKRKNG